MSFKLNKVSIALATYNGKQYLEKQLDSILSQTFKNLEVIVCDDDSCDDTVKIIKKYQKIDERIKLFQNENNLGYVKNFEKAISLCNGDFIALADQDDIWLESKIQILLENIGDNLLIHTDASLIDENDSLINKGWKSEVLSHTSFKDFLFSNNVTGCTVMFKRELLKDILPFPDGLAYHDWWLGMSAAKYKKIIYLNKPLILYRQHTLQDTSAKTPNIFSRIVIDKIKRLAGKNIYRITIAKKQLNNLIAISKNNKFGDLKNQQILEAISYHQDYLDNYIHIKTFLIGIRNRKNIYFKKNYFCIKNIINDIVG